MTNQGDFQILRWPYLLVTTIPVYFDDAGTAHIEMRWHHDLVQHLHYLPKFTLAAPAEPLYAGRNQELVPVTGELGARLSIVRLPSQRTRAQAIARFPATLRALWKAVGRADVVHVGVAGWPYPFGWIAGPIARIRSKKLVIVVESAPWRFQSKRGSGAPLRKRIEAAVYERLARWLCPRADVSFYTQDAYREQFHGQGGRPAYVTPATWVNDEHILEDRAAHELWDSKLQAPVRFLFAGRLATEKGVDVLLKAVELLRRRGLHGTLHVIGDGPRREAVLAARSGAPFVVEHSEPRPYGLPFFEFLQNYHALVVPSLGDEQPRVVFDAAARAVPVVASSTDGLRPHVENGKTGLLIPPGDAQALANAMSDWADHADDLRSMGLEAMRRVRGQTHRAMHVMRSKILAQHLSGT